MTYYAFLSTPSGAFCVLRGKDGLLHPTAWSNQPPAHLREWAHREVLKNTGVNAPPTSLKEVGPGILVARYNVNMGPFSLSEEYIDEEWMDAGELQAMLSEDAALLSSALTGAIPVLPEKFF